MKSQEAEVRRAVRDAAVDAGHGFDTLVVGAGFAGSVLAERLASQLGQRVLVVDKRPHVGANAYDRHDDSGVRVQGTVNFPNEFAYTRVSEFKHLTGQKHHVTSVVYEYPRAEGDPYYLVPRAENTAMYRLDEDEAEKVQDVSFVGRLATYKYYNMDQVVAQSLTLFKKLAAAHVARRAPGEAAALALAGA